MKKICCSLMLMFCVSSFSYSQSGRNLLTLPDSLDSITPLMRSPLREEPVFPGGDSAFQTFFRENVRYPQSAKDSGIQVIVHVSFIVERDGSISNAEVVQSVGGGIDEEAVCVIQKMPNWEFPKVKPGEPAMVRVQYRMPITFSLPSDTNTNASSSNIREDD